MSDHNLLDQVEQSLEFSTYSHDQSEFDIDDPLYILKSTFPNVKNPEAHLKGIQSRILSVYGIDSEEVSIETALDKIGVSRPEFDILCKGMIESEAEYLAYAGDMYANAVRSKFRPEELSDRTLYDNKLIRR